MPVQQLPAPVLAQIAEAYTQSIQAVVAPLQEQLQAQQQAMLEQAEEIKALREQLAKQAEKDLAAMDHMASAVKFIADTQEANSKKGFFGRLFGK